MDIEICFGKAWRIYLKISSLNLRCTTSSFVIPAKAGILCVAQPDVIRAGRRIEKSMNKSSAVLKPITTLLAGDSEDGRLMAREVEDGGDAPLEIKAVGKFWIEISTVPPVTEGA